MLAWWWATPAAGGAASAGGGAPSGTVVSERLVPVASTSMTPYSSAADHRAFVQAAAIELQSSSDTAESVVADLTTMRDTCRVNTVNVYGLDTWEPAGTTARKDAMFAALNRLGMRVVIRIESYSSTDFAFRVADADAVVATYQNLLRYVSDPARRGLVSYFSLNMPVDDPAVQARLGGPNSALAKTRQADYAQALVERMRSRLGQYGFGNAQLRLMIFYGWDGGYDLPSYAAARPDGYVITNYTYPAGAAPDESAADDVLINVPRLRQAMDRFATQYGGASAVVEYGFHTVQFNAGVVPAQTAGLVATLSAKQRALAATTAFYRGRYGNVTGTSYFGFDLIKHEGRASDVVDWALRYP